MYLWTIKSIGLDISTSKWPVVNCFHFCIFELSKASNRRSRGSRRCCELLSFLYLWTIKSIRLVYEHEQRIVVNCFHFCIFELSKASDKTLIKTFLRLWIAFIFVSLNYQKHQHVIAPLTEISCELLSFLYLWTIKSIFILFTPQIVALWIAFIFVSLNYQKHLNKHKTSDLSVVNCFHFCIFELSKASDLILGSEVSLLWIAFIFVSLNYQKHL